MKNLLIAVATFFVTATLAQNPAESQRVMQELEKYNIKPYEMVLQAQPLSPDYAFDIEVNIPDEKYPVNYTATYDPAREPAWIMTGYNGKEPETYQEDILKTMFSQGMSDTVLIDTTSLKSSTKGNYLLVIFHVNPNTVSKEYEFLKDCEARVYISKQRGQLFKVNWVNFRPTMFKGHRVKKISYEVFFTEVDGHPRVIKETVKEGEARNSENPDGSPSFDQMIIYSNYRKVE